MGMTNEELNMTIDYLKEIQESYIEGEGYERHPLPEWYALNKAIEALEQIRWIPVSKRLPDKGRWVLVTAESYQKPVEIMCYQGVRIGQHDVGNGWEDYEYPSWTSGHGDIQSHHPEAWMPLPETYKAESEK